MLFFSICPLRVLVDAFFFSKYFLQVADAAQEMLFLYDVWQDYSDHQIPAILTKLRNTTV